MERKRDSLIITISKENKRLSKHLIRGISRWFYCLGCKLCELICPRKAIIVKKVGERFRPTIDSSKCTGCLLCNNLCPVGTFYEKAFMDEHKL
ncbi:MAG: 4Fe-4S binding protein [Candidatus Njordarchaeales archaeon]